MNNDRFKFRVWDFVKKKMHYFDLFEYADDQDCYYNSYVFPSEQDFKNGKAILLQSTGLKDENGKLIFEGDLVIYIGYSYETPLEIKFGSYLGFGIQSSGTGFYLFTGEVNGGSDRGIFMWQGDCPLIEVIGNIYENPELLEKK